MRIEEQRFRSTGIVGYPVALKPVGSVLPRRASLQPVRFVVFTAGDLDVQAAALDELVAGVG